MLRYTYRFAEALLAYADENGLEIVYRQALQWVTQLGSIRYGLAQERGHGADLPPASDMQAGIASEPPLGLFLEEVPPNQREAVLDRFINIARDRLNLVEAEVTSAVPLTAWQQQMIEIRLIRMLKKQIDLVATVDASLLGGIRIVVGSVVIDDTLKRKLSDMRDSIRKGVFQSE